MSLAMMHCGGRVGDECPTLHGSYSVHSVVVSSDCPNVQPGTVGDATQYFPSTLPGSRAPLCVQTGCAMRCAEGKGSSEWVLDGEGGARVTTSDGTCTSVLDATIRGPL